MTNDTIVEQLLNANVRLTEQIVRLAEACITNPPVIMEAAKPAEPLDSRKPEAPFTMSSLEDWNDIGGFDKTPKTLHVSEAEEDIQFAKAAGLIGAEQVSELLAQAGAINTEITTG